MKRTFLAVFALLTAITLIIGFVLAQQEAEQAINDARQQWQDLYQAGDAEGAAQLYTEDAVVFRGGAVIEGRNAIQEALQQQMNRGFTQSRVESFELEVLNDTAYDIGRFTTTNEDGERMLEGHFLAILKRDNGAWLLHRHFSYVLLPEGMMPAMMGGPPPAAAQGPRPPLVPCEDAEPMPCMMRATQLSDIAGIWRVYFPRPDLNAPDGMAYQRINSDGKLIHADTIENTTAPYGRWPHGRYTFEDGVLVLTVESEGSPPGCETGRFEPWVYRHGAQPVALLLATLEDHCPGRPGHPPFVWVAPAD